MSRLIFAAERTDGLGARLCAIVNGMALAKKYGGKFRFKWNPMEVSGGWHGVPEVDEVFSSNFINLYLDKTSSDLSTKISFPKFLEDRHFSLGQVDRSESLVVDAPWLLPEEWHTLAGLEFIQETCPASWREIEFTHKLRDVIHSATDLEISPYTVGIHLRAGDVIYSRERYNQRFATKAIPYQLAAEFLRYCREKMRPAIIFGQDSRLCKALSETFNASWIEDILPIKNWTQTEREIFEITLISRCSELVGAESAFFNSGAMRGGKQAHNISQIYELQKRKDIILTSKDSALVAQAATSEQKAFSLWTVAIDLLEQSADNGMEALLIVDEASRYDPGNGFYLLVRAWLMVRCGAWEQAETLLANAAQTSHEGSLLYVISLPKYNKYIRWVCNSFSQVAGEDMPWAQACLAIGRGVKDSRQFLLARKSLETLNLPPEWRARLFDALERAFNRELAKKTALQARNLQERKRHAEVKRNQTLKHSRNSAVKSRVGKRVGRWGWLRRLMRWP